MVNKSTYDVNYYANDVYWKPQNILIITQIK